MVLSLVYCHADDTLFEVMLCMLFVLIVIVFVYNFTCISFAIRPSGRKFAITLIELI